MPRPDDAPETPFSTRVETGEVLPVGGGYRLLKRLGQGAFGEVWRAEAPGGVEVAVKLISRTVKPEEARRELEALEVIKRLRHHYLLSLQAFFPLPDRLIILLELADTSLRARLRECEKTGQGLPPADLLRYTLEAAEALDYLHEQKVQHRDIKPDNLLLLGNHIKVADFGLARVLETVMLQSASQAGTPAYMAPEIWSGKLSAHSDQYSLAICYAELRLGRFPLGYDNLANLLYAHLHGKAELDPLPEAEQAALRRALAKEPGDRYPSCTAFVQALIAAYRAARRSGGGNSTNAKPVPVAPRPQVSAEVQTKPPSSHRTEASLKPPSAPGKLDVGKRQLSRAAKSGGPVEGTEAQQLRQAILLDRLRHLLSLHQKPRIRTWIGTALLGALLGFFGFIVMGGLASLLGYGLGLSEHNIDVLGFVVGIPAGIGVFVMSVYLFFRKHYRRRARDRVKLIAKLVEDYSQEVRSWGGEDVLREAVSLRELIRILEKKRDS
jgi:serine/threonine protein kinase